MTQENSPRGEKDGKISFFVSDILFHSQLIDRWNITHHQCRRVWVAHIRSCQSISQFPTVDRMHLRPSPFKSAHGTLKGHCPVVKSLDNHAKNTRRPEVYSVRTVPNYANQFVLTATARSHVGTKIRNRRCKPLTSTTRVKGELTFSRRPPPRHYSADWTVSL